MELSFNQLKKLQVICVSDGKNLGRVCDITFLYPENCIKGFTVSGGAGFKFMRDEQFIPWESISKIGEDVILVKTEKKNKDCPPAKKECPPGPCKPHGQCPPGPSFSRRDAEDYE